MRLPETFEIEISDLVFGGEGIGHYGDRPVFVFGVLPGEKVTVNPVKVRRKFIKAELVQVLTSSKHRINHQEEHYLTCSPWQILPYSLQLEYKKILTQKMWQNFTNENYPSTKEVCPSPQQFGYRNKLEFSFGKGEKGELTLAFHRRYKFSEFYNFKNCVLGASMMNNVAEKIIKTLNQNNVDLLDLKNLTLRYSFFENKVLATLLVKNKNFKTFNFEDSSLANWRIAYSNPTSPMAIESEVLFEHGTDSITEKLGDNLFQYCSKNFFQVNTEAFVPVLDFIKQHLQKGDKLVDLYSGVGVLGIALGENFKKLVFAEKDPTAKSFNQKNLELNGLEKNAIILSGESEKQDLEEILGNTDVLVIDPPRSGMHPKVLKRIIEAKPKQIIYVSCNPSTQARDYKILRDLYKPQAANLVDLYPQTPHIESIVIMTLK